jgi:hypothetical protein
MKSYSLTKVNARIQYKCQNIAVSHKRTNLRFINKLKYEYIGQKKLQIEMLCADRREGERDYG